MFFLGRMKALVNMTILLVAFCITVVYAEKIDNASVNSQTDESDNNRSSSGSIAPKRQSDGNTPSKFIKTLTHAETLPQYDRLQYIQKSLATETDLEYECTSFLTNKTESKAIIFMKIFPEGSQERLKSELRDLVDVVYARWGLYDVGTWTDVTFFAKKLKRKVDRRGQRSAVLIGSLGVK